MANCFERIKEIAAGKYSDAEIRQILKDTENELAERENIADVSGASLQDVINSRTEELQKSAEQETFLLDREELNVARSANLYKGFEKLKKNPLKRFGESLTLGTRVGVKGSGARTIIVQTRDMGMSGRVELDDAIRKVDGGMETLKSSEYDKVILDAVNGKETTNKIANALGKNVRELREDNLKRMEKHGIVTTRIENRGIYQTHDATKLLKTADSLIERTKILKDNFREVDRARKLLDISFERWKGRIDPLLDLVRTFGADTAKNEGEMNKIYREIFDAITSDATSVGKSSIQDQVNSNRFFHFKDSASQLEYNKQFGTGNLFDSLMQEADTTGSRLATLEMAGNRPLRYIEKTIRLAARNAERTFTKAEVNKAVDEAKYNMQQALGISTTVHGASGKLVNAIKLALLAQIAPSLLPLVTVSDIAPSINVMSQLGGRGAFRSATKLFGIAKDVLRDDPELFHYTQAMGFRRDIQLGSIHKWTGIENANLRGKLATFMMKLSPHEFMNYVEGLSTAHEITLMLGQNSKVAFDKLPTGISKALDLYGIDEDRWNLMRQGTTTIGDTTHVTSDALRNLDEEKIKDFLRKKFNLQKVSDFRVEQERAQTQQLFSQMISDKMATASNLVDARQRGFWSLRFDLNTEKGRRSANLFSIFGSLRYYETAIVHRTLAPLIYGESGESAIHQILGGKFDKIGLARWAAASFTRGMFGFTLQSLMKGKEPNLSEILTRSALAPMGAIGQGLEIGSGYDHKAARTVLGPGPSMLFDSVDDLSKILRWDHPGRNAVNLVGTIFPGLNNSAARHAMHHLMQDQSGHMWSG